MRLPLSWLKDYLDLNESVDKLAESLTLAGLEVDSIETAPLSFSNVVVAKVRNVSPHPHANRLKIAEVFDGTTSLSVVCGDPKCHSGMKTALAQIGAHLTDEKGKKHAIKKTTLRGIESYGMLCSEKELGLSDHGEGIMSFAEEIPTGTSLEDLYGETVFEISLTPNLGHCMSALGVARELSAILNLPLKKNSFSMQESSRSIEEAIQLDRLDSHHVFSYTCRLIRFCHIGPSPDWLQKRLEQAGMRSVNAIVDVTNYIMLDLGQPLHAFDYDHLNEKNLSVYLSSSPHSLKLLDGKVYSIPSDTLMVYAGKDPIAIAGVMGSAHSEVTETSENILLEAAYFSPSLVRKSSRALGIRSEASSRFERGIDGDQVIYALDKAAALIAEITGGEIAKGTQVKTTQPEEPRKIRCSTSKANALLGTTLSSNEVEEIFKRLNMNLKPIDRDQFEVEIPSYRNDMTQEIDLIEEIARLFGYNNIPRGTIKAPISHLPHSPLFMLEKKVRTQLVAEGLQEFLSCNLISPNMEHLFTESSLPFKDTIAVLQPSSQEQSILRTSLLPSLIQAIQVNISSKQFSISAFEIGHIHFKEGKEHQERAMVAIALTGKARPHHWKEKGTEVDFFDLKGIVENLLEAMGITQVSFSPSTLKSFHPQSQAHIQVGSLNIGSLGEVSPEKLLTLDMTKPIFFAEIDLIDLLKVMPHKHTMTPLPLYPESERDWTLTLPSHLSAADILAAIDATHSKLLKKVTVWDLYQKTHLTLRFTYRSDRETIEYAQVENEHERITQAVTSSLQLQPPLK